MSRGALRIIFLFILILFNSIVFGQYADDPFQFPVGLGGYVTMGVNFGDYDNDGDVDMHFSNGTQGYTWPNHLFENDGNGNFTEVTGAGPIITEEYTSGGAAWGDYDNDGDLDLIVGHGFTRGSFPTNYSKVSVYQNNGDGTFSNAASSDLTAEESSRSKVGGMWGDYNNDGYIDAFISNAAFMGGGENHALYDNNQDGTFTEVSNNMTNSGSSARAGASWIDVDGDGDLDIVTVSGALGQKTVLWVNTGSNFEEHVLIESGPDEGRTSQAASWGDYDNDGDPDLFITNGGDSPDFPEANIIFRNDGVDVNGEPILTRVGSELGDIVTDEDLSMPSAWVDYDNDGDLDMFVGNDGGYPGGYRSRLYVNNGDGTFTKKTNTIVADSSSFCRSAAWADVNNDGFMDLMIGRDGPNRLYINNGNSNNYVHINLTGNDANKAAIGTIVRVKATINGEPVWQMRDVNTQTGYGSHNDLRLHFGLGNATVIDSIKIEWHGSGRVDVYKNVAVNQVLNYSESAGANRPPNAVNDSDETEKNTAVTIDVLSNDSDPDGDALSVSDVFAASNGTVTNNGTDVTYTPDTEFIGTDNFDYEVSDGNGGLDTATVTVTVNEPNQRPQAADDNAVTDEDVAVTIDVLANDSDPENDPLTVSNVWGAGNGTLTNNGSDVTYTPNTDYNGSDSFNYEVSDGNGGLDTALVTVTINAVNDPPVAANDDATTNEDTAVDIDVLSNDDDVDGDALSVSAIVIQATHGTATTDGSQVTYTPAADYNGPDSFEYEVSDGNGGLDTAMVNVTVNAVNDRPVAANDNATTDEDTQVTINVLANDSDPDSDPLTVSNAWGASHGTLINNGNNITYDPAADYNGSDTFQYEVSDGNGGLDTATVDVTINAVNDDPVAVDDEATTDEDTAVDIAVLINDSDVDGDVLTVSQIITEPSNGTVVNRDTMVTYTPDPDFNGSDGFEYEVDDGNGGTAIALVNITVNPVNDRPVAANDEATTNEDTAVNIDVLSNDDDVDGDALSISAIVTQATHGTATTDGSQVTYTPDAGYNGPDSFEYEVSDGNGGLDTATVSVTVNAVNDRPLAVDDDAATDEDVAVNIDVLANDSDPDGDEITVSDIVEMNNGSVVINIDSTVTYTPNANYNGTDTFKYEVSDGNGGLDTATVTVTVNAVNDRPVAVDDAATTDEDVAVNIDVLSNDSDVDGDPLSVSGIVVKPQHGTATINAGQITYTPDENFNGADFFQYEVSDGNGGLDTAAVDVTVNSINDVPVAVNDTLSHPEDSTATIDVLANDQDADGDGLLISAYSQAQHGTVAVQGDTLIIYTPDSNFFGSDSFTYVITDNEPDHMDTAWVFITVYDINDPPEIVDLTDKVVLQQNESTQIYMADHASDVDTPYDLLVWSFETSGPEISYFFNEETDTLTITAGETIGEYFLYCTLTDDSSASDMDTIIVQVDLASALGTDFSGIPKEFTVHQNYPNPFNPLTNIRVGLPKAGDLRIDIYNTAGQRVRTIVAGRKTAGYHVISIDGSRLASGMYVYRVQAGEHVKIKRMILLK